MVWVVRVSFSFDSPPSAFAPSVRVSDPAAVFAASKDLFVAELAGSSAKDGRDRKHQAMAYKQTSRLVSKFMFLAPEVLHTENIALNGGSKGWNFANLWAFQK